MDPVRVLLVADDPLARSGIAHSLAGESAVVVVAGEASSRDDLAHAVADARARVVVRDVGLGAGDDPGGRAAPGSAPVLALVPDEARATDALARGARGVLFRSTDGGRLAAASAAVAQGLVVLDERLAPALLDRPRAIVAEGKDKLTPRELEVLELLARGLANKQIAWRLDVSEHTAKFHVNSILTKLGAESRTQAVVRAARLGLIAL